jgi:phage tail sheath protein FI
MTQDDTDDGRLSCVVGVAPVEPAEFAIFSPRVGRRMSSAQALRAPRA